MVHKNVEVKIRFKGDKQTGKITKDVLARVPKECEICDSTRIEYWSETDEEFIFRCIDCGTFYPIPIDDLSLYDYPF